MLISEKLVENKDKIQEYAKVMKELMYEVYPKTTEIWSKLYWK